MTRHLSDCIGTSQVLVPDASPFTANSQWATKVKFNLKERFVFKEERKIVQDHKKITNKKRRRKNLSRGIFLAIHLKGEKSILRKKFVKSEKKTLWSRPETLSKRITRMKAVGGCDLIRKLFFVIKPTWWRQLNDESKWTSASWAWRV